MAGVSKVMGRDPSVAPLPQDDKLGVTLNDKLGVTLNDKLGVTLNDKLGVILNDKLGVILRERSDRRISSTAPVV